eukprot:scaffold31314_cov84-Isochrysis_galbana.AAC.1
MGWASDVGYAAWGLASADWGVPTEAPFTRRSHLRHTPAVLYTHTAPSLWWWIFLDPFTCYSHLKRAAGRLVHPHRAQLVVVDIIRPDDGHGVVDALDADVTSGDVILEQSGGAS